MIRHDNNAKETLLNTEILKMNANIKNLPPQKIINSIVFSQKIIKLIELVKGQQPSMTYCQMTNYDLKN